MKTRLRLTALVLIMVLMVSIFASCAQDEPQAPTVPDETSEEIFHTGGQSDEETAINYFALQMVPLSATPAMFNVYNPTAPGTRVRANSNASIDYSNAADGYITIRFLRNTTRRIMVRIEGPSGVEFVYFLRTDGQFEVFPLSDGNGRYTVRVFENIEGNRWSLAHSTQITATLDDEFAPFLRPNQFVNFNSESKAVAKAAELVEDYEEVLDKVRAIFEFVIENISYDFQLARTVQSGYVPDIDRVLERGKGICFDYASLMAAMLRSLEIPTRLVIGYAGTAYHAWIDVWSEEAGWLNTVIFFDGEDWTLIDPTFAAAGTRAAMAFIGDGTNYTALRLY
jgi:hypothetical protein